MVNQSYKTEFRICLHSVWANSHVSIPIWIIIDRAVSFAHTLRLRVVKYAWIWLTVIVYIYKLADTAFLYARLVRARKRSQPSTTNRIEPNKQRINGQKLSIWLFTFLFCKLNYVYTSGIRWHTIEMLMRVRDPIKSDVFDTQCVCLDVELRSEITNIKLGNFNGFGPNWIIFCVVVSIHKYEIYGLELNYLINND